MIWRGNKRVVTTRYRAKIADFGLSKMRIVHLSDVQGYHFGGELVERIARFSPDVILVTGDLIDRRMNDFLDTLVFARRLSKVAPVFYCLGNHELSFSRAWLREFIEEMERMDITVLDGEAYSLRLQGFPIGIAGFPEELVMVEGKNRTKRNEDVDLEAVKAESIRLGDGLEKAGAKLKLLMAHEPQFIVEYAKGDFHLIFSGHAHGGQIRLPLIGGLFAPGQGIFPRLTSGVHKAGRGKMIISRGLGNSTFPIRISNRPEIVIVDVESL